MKIQSSNDTLFIEKVSYVDLTDEEKASLEQAEKDLANGDMVEVNKTLTGIDSLLTPCYNLNSTSA